VATINALLDLAVGRRCLDCDQIGPSWCNACLRDTTDVHVRSTPAGTIVVAAAHYRGSVRTAVLSYKEQGHLALATPLGRLLAAAIAAGTATGIEAGPGPFAGLVPVPSTRVATRSRGHDHAYRLARRAAAVTGGSARSVLSWARPVRDQSALSVVQRRFNVSGAMVARPPVVQGTRVILVDDVMTTGATLDEGVRVLTTTGYHVVATCVVAAVDARRALAPRDRLR
jgi:predicted amidophosphoribosyltransferase